MIIRADGCPDPRRYNAPSVPEIAVLLPGGGYSEGVGNRDIVLHAHSGSLKRITETHCASDSLHYVLLFSKGDTNATELGRNISLPSSYTNFPRQMSQLYQDAMTIVRKFGNPDLFITFTCNPLWDEITCSLLLNQKATDHPDLIIRVFRQKLRELLNVILKKHVLGKPIGHVYTIEFQKHGLPHAHILVILVDDFKPRDPSDYDKIVCAELPDPDINPRLHQTVKRCMLHGLCGIAKKAAL